VRAEGVVRLAELAFISLAAAAALDAALTIHLDRLADAGFASGFELNPLYRAGDGTADAARVLAGRGAAVALCALSAKLVRALERRPRLLKAAAAAALAALAVNALAVANNLFAAAVGS